MILALTVPEPIVRNWVAGNPLTAIDLHSKWPNLLAAYRWLDDHRGSGRYLREITAPGVDTKFVERNRGVLARLLGAATSSLTDVTARLDELRHVRIAVRTAIIVENEVTFLSAPVPTGGIVLWGKGFEVGRAGSLQWLREADVHYWGDLDTHGFAILNQLRVWLPQVRSFLMDRQTLLAHKDRWGVDSAPTRARLEHLDTTEESLYENLVSDRLGDRVRLEQERIDWSWAEQRFPSGPRAG